MADDKKPGNIATQEIYEELIDALSTLPENKQKELLEHVKHWISDERDNNRKPYFTHIDYSDKHRIEHGTIKNISSGGLFIQPAASYPTGRSIILKFEHPDMPKHMKLNGKIVWKNSRGMGVRFDHKIDDLTEH